MLFSREFSGGDEILWEGDKNLMKRKSNGGRIFPGGGDEQILDWWGAPPSTENPVIPYIKAKKKNYFYNLEKFKN